MAQTIQIRRGSAAEWVMGNPILASGELGVELDTGLYKIGNGVDAWDDLSYAQNLTVIPSAIYTGNHTLANPDAGTAVEFEIEATASLLVADDLKKDAVYEIYNDGPEELTLTKDTLVDFVLPAGFDAVLPAKSSVALRHRGASNVYVVSGQLKESA